MEAKVYSTTWGNVSAIGKRETMEDAIRVAPNFLKCQDSQMHLFAVYDGHGGPEVAVYSSMHFHEILARYWDAEALITKEKMKELLVRSFEDLDRELPSLKGYREDVGSTALVVLVSTSDIFVANCGDSRAVLCRTTEVLPLSDDHKPDRADEQRRIEDLDGLVLNNQGARVFGVLAMSRSLGDAYMRPWVIPTPEVKAFHRTTADECMVIATDGLWDVLTNDEAAKIALRVLQKKRGSKNAAHVAANYLLRFATQRGSCDNISIIVVDLKSPFGD